MKYWMGWMGVRVIPGCETSGRFGTEVHFSHICRTCWDRWLVCQVVLVVSGAAIHDVFGCLFPNSAFYSDGVCCAPYFVQPVLVFRVVATSLTTHHHLLFP